MTTSNTIAPSAEPRFTKLQFTIGVSIALVIMVSVFWGARFCVWWIFGSNVAGDAIEFSAAVFSALALAGVVVALMLQQKELKLAHQELQETQRLLFEQREEVSKSSAALAKQNFEATFFRMLEVLESIRKDITLRKSANSNPEFLQGRPAIRSQVDRLLRHQLSHLEACDVPTKYMQIYETELADSFGQYFRTVYRTLKYVDSSQIEDKKFYTGILRAQMSNSELFMLFYNCTSSLGSVKAKPLIEKYEMFDNFPSTELANPGKHRKLIASRLADDPPSITTKQSAPSTQ